MNNERHSKFKETLKNTIPEEINEEDEKEICKFHPHNQSNNN